MHADGTFSKTSSYQYTLGNETVEEHEELVCHDNTKLTSLSVIILISAKSLITWTQMVFAVALNMTRYVVLKPSVLMAVQHAHTNILSTQPKLDKLGADRL